MIAPSPQHLAGGRGHSLGSKLAGARLAVYDLISKVVTRDGRPLVISHARIAALLGVSRLTVQRHVRRLVSHGQVHIRPSRVPYKARWRAVFEYRLPPEPAKAPLPDDHAAWYSDFLLRAAANLKKLADCNAMDLPEVRRAVERADGDLYYEFWMRAARMRTAMPGASISEWMRSVTLGRPRGPRLQACSNP